ncbi:hypothetical protein ACFP56_19350 [Paenibacillus septentrionalis]|uniref:PAS domain-containing protein n=1 Tax=Paenibacillus septentrionalis TaxID=429342 RepID=A0ABW1VBD8_9BACL
MFEQWNLTQNWWYLAVAAGIIILLWFIARDLPLHIHHLRSIRHAKSKHQPQTESVVLLSADLHVIGANQQFYTLTGLSEIKPYETSLQDISKIFPEETREASVQRLSDIIEQGKGSLELTIQSARAKEQPIVIESYCINDGTEFICNYVTMKLNQNPLRP